MNSRDVTCRINISELKTLFLSNHEEADTKTVYCSTSFNKSCIAKATGTDMLILMVYAFVVEHPEHGWYMQTEKHSFVSIRIYEKSGSTICLLLPQFHAITGCDTVSYFFNVSKRVVFKRASSGVTPFNMIVESGSSKIIRKSANNEVTKFIQRYVYRGKKVEGIVKIRMRQYYEIKTKTTQVILLDRNSLIQFIIEANISLLLGALNNKEYTESAHVYLVENVNKKLELPSFIFVVRLQSIASVKQQTSQAKNT